MTPSSAYYAFVAFLPVLAAASPAAEILGRTLQKDTSKACYFPSGNVAYGNVPCSDDGTSAFCCGSKDACLTNGLCLVGDDDKLAAKENEGIYYARGSCTDENWGDACFKFCRASMPGSPASNGGAIFQCSGKGYNQPNGATYCCETGVNAKDSCCSGSTFSLAQGFRGSQTVPPAPSTTTTKPPAPQITNTTTVIAGSTYTVPCTTQGGSVVVLWPSTLSCNVGCPMGPTGPVTTQPSVTADTNVAGMPTKPTATETQPSSTETAAEPIQTPPEPAVSSSTTTSTATTTSSSAGRVSTTASVGGNGDSTQPILVPNAASPLAASLAVLLATAMACIAMV